MAATLCGALTPAAALATSHAPIGRGHGLAKPLDSDSAIAAALNIINRGMVICRRFPV
jgi:hypothetical protein